MAPYSPVGPDFANPRYYTGMVRELAPPQDHIGDRYLPRRDMPGDSISWDQLLFRSPIAPFVAKATESPRLGEGAMLQRWADAMKVSHKSVFDENDLRWLRLAGDADMTTPQGAMASAARRRMEQRAADLDAGVENRIEWWQMNTLRGSVIKTADSFSDLTFSYTLPVTTQTANPLWSATTTADPLKDIFTWLGSVTYKVDRAITSRKVMGYLAQNTKVLGLLFPQIASAPSFVSIPRLQTLLSTEFGLTVEIYDSVYTTDTFDGATPNVTDQPFIPANEFILLPSGPLGTTWEAPAPQNNYKTGKFTWLDEPGAGMRSDPWVVEMGCGWNGIPTLDRPELHIVATVAA